MREECCLTFSRVTTAHRLEAWDFDMYHDTVEAGIDYVVCMRRRFPKREYRLFECREVKHSVTSPVSQVAIDFQTGDVNDG